MVGATVEAVYENGVLRPLAPIDGLAEHSRVTVQIIAEPKRHPLADVIGILPDEDAREIQQIINEEFGRVDPDAWK